MNNTIKISVIKYLEANHGTNWCWSGIISRAVHEETGHKESVIERHGLRKLREEGILEVDYAQVDGSGPKCSRYRVKPLEAYSTRPENGIICVGCHRGNRKLDGMMTCMDCAMILHLQGKYPPIPQEEKLNL